MCRFLRILLCGVALLVPALAAAAPPAIFAAASLKPALDEMAHAGLLGAPAAQRVYAASSALARQIEGGAPATIFISADERWMDDVASHGAIVPGTRTNLLGNALVLIAPVDSTARVELADGAAPLLRQLGANGRIAVALTDSVPAGIYAKESLTSLGMWSTLAPHLAGAQDVRAALNLVSLRQCPFGIVYRSDAVSEPRVKVLATFPTTSHRPIEYPLAIVKGHDDAAARKLVADLESPRAQAIFRRWGFTVLAR